MDKGIVDEERNTSGKNYLGYSSLRIMFRGVRLMAFIPALEDPIRIDWLSWRDITQKIKTPVINIVPKKFNTIVSRIIVIKINE